MPVRLIEQDGGVRFEVKVVPGASRERIVGELGDALKVAVSKPAQAGAANAAVVTLLAEALNIPRSAVRIVRGHTTPRKQFHLAGMNAEQVRQRIAAAVR